MEKKRSHSGKLGSFIKMPEKVIPETIDNPDYHPYLWRAFQHEVTKLLKSKNPNAEFLLPTENDKHFIGTLIRYFAKDKSFYDSQIIANKKSLNKGLFIMGNCGVGKTLTMTAFNRCNAALGYAGNNFKVTTCNNIVRRYDAKGQMAIDAFMEQAWYFDDFGMEEEGMNFGKKTNVMKLIIEERSDLFNRTGIKTHISSNLDLEEIQKKYGVRVYDRIHEMFNVVVYAREESFRQI